MGMSRPRSLLVGENQESVTLKPTGDPQPHCGSPRTPPSIPGLGAYTYHCQCHAVNLMLVFGLVLPEGAVPRQERLRSEDRNRGTEAGRMDDPCSKPGMVPL